jgi:hypothetical protein
MKSILQAAERSGAAAGCARRAAIAGHGKAASAPAGTVAIPAGPVTALAADVHRIV